MLWVAKAARCGNEVATDGKAGGKNGKAVMRAAPQRSLHAALLTGAIGRVRLVWHDIRLFKVLAARGGVVVIELKYHRRGGTSRNLTSYLLPWEGKGSWGKGSWGKVNGIAGVNDQRTRRREHA